MTELDKSMEVDMGGGRVKVVPMNLPGNSHNKKVEPERKEEKKVKKVVNGKVTQRKKPLGKKMVETFVGEDIADVKGYVIHDVLIPAIKNAVTDMVQGGIEMLLFGERKGARTGRDKGRSYVSYNSYSGNKRDERSSNRSKNNRASHNFDDIILNSRGEAEEVLSSLVELVEVYGQSTVGDLYDLVGISSNFTDAKWGWKNLSSATVDRVRDGYLLNLPKTVLLD